MSNEPTTFSLARLERDGAPMLAVVTNGHATPVWDVAPNVFAPDADLLALLADWQASFAALMRGVSEGRAAHGVPVDGLRVLAPIPNPRQLFCTGRNYGKHAVEMLLSSNSPLLEGVEPDRRRAVAEEIAAKQTAVAQPFVFMKPTTSITGPNDDMILPDWSSEVDWEVELTVVFGASGYRTPRAAALDLVAGYMIGNDVTARDMVRRNEPNPIGPDWIAAKGAPGFLPTGPWFVPAAFVRDPHDLAIGFSLNGRPFQAANTGEMTFDIPRQIEFLTRHARVLPGDLLCTGSPPGNGAAHGIALKPGDVMRAWIDGLGEQVATCRAPDWTASG